MRPSLKAFEVGPKAGPAVLRIARGRRATFVCIDESEHCIDFGMASHARFLFSAFQDFGVFVVPTPLPHEFVPDVNLGIGRTLTLIETPPQNFLVGPAFPYSSDYIVVLHMQKFDAELIETSAEIGLIVGRQFVFLMDPNLIEHASEIDKTVDFCRWATNA